jgi:hypothetical protein
VTGIGSGGILIAGLAQARCAMSEIVGLAILASWDALMYFGFIATGQQQQIVIRWPWDTIA